MTANLYGAADRVAKAGDTMTGPLVLSGTPPLEVTSGVAAGNVLTLDASGNVTPQPPGAVSGVAWVNVRSRGATGNGTTNDTAAVQAAITAAGVGGGVYFPAGTYVISSSLMMLGGQLWVGDGWQSVIKQANGSNLSTLVTTSTTSLPTSNVLIRDLMIDGNRTNNTGSTCYGLYLYATQYSMVHRVRVQNMNGDAYRIDGSSSGGFSGTSSTIHLVDCWAYGCANNGLVTTSFAADVHILGGDFGFCGASAITMQGGSSSIRDAVLWGVTGGPGLTIGAQAIQVTNCNVEGNYQQGIVVNQYGSYALISGCKVYDNSTAGNGSYDGIFINGVSGTSVTGVIVSNCQIFPDAFAGGTTQRYAINLGTYHQQCQIVGNNVGFAGSSASWAPSNSLVTGEGQSDYVVGNPGFNPVGPLSMGTLVSLAPTGTTYTNPWGLPVTVYVTGGTVTAIAVNGTATGLTSGAFRLGPGQTIKFTYTGTPAWVWIGD